MHPRIVLIAFALASPLDGTAAQEPSRTPRSVGVIGAGMVFGPGVIAQGRNAGGGMEPMLARWRDGVAVTLGLGLEASWGGAELRLMLPTRELEVRNEAGDLFPHHASPPLVWTIGAIAYPMPRIGQGIGRRLRPFVAAGAGGMLVSADLDNANGPSLFHPWHWIMSGGLRLDVGLDDPRSGISVVEVRWLEMRLAAMGPFVRSRATAISVALGLRL